MNLNIVKSDGLEKIFPGTLGANHLNKGAALGLMCRNDLK